MKVKLENASQIFSRFCIIFSAQVYYGAGCLNVHLGKAKLCGRRSQDPYAVVYLLEEATGRCSFQRGSRHTDVFNQNIEPNFNKTFYFKVDIDLIVHCEAITFSD